MKNFVYVILISFFFISFSAVLLASPTPTIYVNNKPFTGQIYTYNDIVYVEGALLLTFMNVPHSSTPTKLILKDTRLQEKLYNIAVWVDFKDGRGNIIAFPLKTVADTMGGKYVYYPDTNTVDMVSYSRNNTAPAAANNKQTTQPASNNPSHGTSASNPVVNQSGDNVNPFNTTKILHDAQNSVNLYQDQNNGK